MKNLTWQNPEQLFVAQGLINKVKSKCCGIKDNIFYDYIRSKKETSGLETWEIDAVYQTEQRQVGEHMDIYRGLSQLKEVERTCITLFFMEDLPIEKIAVITGMPAGTIKSHLSRGKTKLTTFLKQNGYDGKR